jgi:hypothetical protein
MLGEMPAGLPRANKHVIAAHAMGLDIEDCTEQQVADICKKLARWEWILATTHKHGAIAAHEDPDKRSRVRVVLPLQEPIPKKLHKFAWEALNSLCQSLVDKQTRDISRLFYLPSTFDLTKAFSFHNEGLWLDAQQLVGFSLLEAGSAAVFPEAAVDSARLSKELFDLRRGLRTIDKNEVTPSGTHLKPILQLLLAGEPFADKGHRHQTILDLTLFMAWRFLKKKLSTEAIRILFTPSIAAMTAVHPEDPPTIEEVVTAWEGAAGKINVSEQQYAAEKDAEQAEQALEYQLENRNQIPYTNEDLCRIAVVAGISHEPAEAEQALNKRWILQAGEASYYLLHESGNYKGPYGPSQGRTAAVELLARAPVRLNELSPKGCRRRPLQELAEDYGTVSSSTVLDLTLDFTHFDEKSRIVYEAARPHRPDILPVYDPHIEAWLRVFCGRAFEKVCDWMACAPDLNKLLCALYLSGHTGAGKTLFGQGLAHLWSETPGKFDAVTSNFNEELLRCPLVLADEDLGTPTSWKTDVSGELRSMLSTLERTVTRKYLPPAAMRGAVRMVIAANNDLLLASRSSLTNQDLEAMAQRFLYIRVTKDSTDLLNDIPTDTKNYWRSRGIAQHMLWLSQNREVKQTRRFWVEGDVSSMHRLLTISSDWSSKVCEWLVRFLLNPKVYSNRNDGLVRVGKGRLLINEQAIVDGWKLYHPDTRIEPETAKIGKALRAVSEEKRVQLRWRGSHIRYRDIMTETLFAWADLHGIGDRHTLLRGLWGDEQAPREPGEDEDGGNVTDDLASIPALNSVEEPF